MQTGFVQRKRWELATMMPRSVLIHTMLVCFLTSSRIFAQPGLPNPTTVTTPVTLDQGPDAKQIRETAFEVITTAASLQTLWERVHGSGPDAPVAPFIDFNTFQVVGAFAGQRPSGGYVVKLHASQVDDQTVVTEFEIEAAPVYADANPTMMMEAPYLLVLVPANRPVTTRWRIP